MKAVKILHFALETEKNCKIWPNSVARSLCIFCGLNCLHLRLKTDPSWQLCRKFKRKCKFKFLWMRKKSFHVYNLLPYAAIHTYYLRRCKLAAFNAIRKKWKFRFCWLQMKKMFHFCNGLPYADTYLLSQKGGKPPPAKYIFH